jgi:hypothetical protein
MERSLFGFLHVAAQRDYARRPVLERRRIRKRYDAVETRAEALELMQEAKIRLRVERKARRATVRAAREEQTRISSR